jgi:hypothetical protein
MNEQNDRSITSAIKKLAGTYNVDTIYLVTGRVLSVDEAAGTCLVEAVTGKATTTIDGVELQTTISDGLLMVPKIDSEVKVLFSTYTTPFIVQFGDVEKIYIAADLIQFNDGALNGMVKITPLVDKLNALEKDINTLKGLLSGMVSATAALPPPTPVIGSVLAGIFTPLTSYSSQLLVQTTKTQIENPLITQ